MSNLFELALATAVVLLTALSAANFARRLARALRAHTISVSSAIGRFAAFTLGWLIIGALAVLLAVPFLDSFLSALADERQAFGRMPMTAGSVFALALAVATLAIIPIAFWFRNIASSLTREEARPG